MVWMSRLRFTKTVSFVKIYIFLPFKCSLAAYLSISVQIV